jgi:acyl carrier protein
MKHNIKSKVLQIVEKISGTRIKNFDPEGDIKSQLTLDSIQLIELFAALEIEFGIELPLEIMNSKNGKEFLDKLEKELTDNDVIHV